MNTPALAPPGALARLARAPLRWLVLTALAVALLVASRGLWLGAVGDLLVVSDSLQPADAIIVLAGNAPARAAHGMDLFRAGYAPRLIISDEPVRTHALEITWSELHRLGVAPFAVPDTAIEILPISANTHEEAVRNRDILLRDGLRSAILVTDPFHSRRALMTFAHVFEPAGLQVRSSPADDPAGDMKLWWQNEKKALAVLDEYLKLVYYAVRGRLF